MREIILSLSKALWYICTVRTSSDVRSLNSFQFCYHISYWGCFLRGIFGPHGGCPGGFCLGGFCLDAHMHTKSKTIFQSHGPVREPFVAEACKPHSMMLSCPRLYSLQILPGVRSYLSVLAIFNDHVS